MKGYVLKGRETVHLPKEADHPVIREFLQNYTTGVQWDTVFDAERNTLYIGNPTAVSPDGEDYCINVTEDGAFVSGSTYSGLMHGFVTLLKRIVCTDFEEYTVEGGEETGSPKIAFRSAHICVFPETKLDFLRKAVRMCVIGKYSHLIIEFWGTLKMDCFELFGWKDAYTKAQIKEIFDEVRAFGIELIPFFQHWGHAALSRGGASGKHVVLDQDVRYEYLYKPHSGGWVYDFKNPKTLALLKSARDELCELCGDGEYFHIGCDEAEHLKTVKEAKDVLNYINTVAEELKAQGRRAIVWGDMFLSKKFFAEGSKYECNSSLEVAKAMIDGLSRDVIIADWQYNVSTEKWESSKLFKENGFDVVCCAYDGRVGTSKAVETAYKWGMMGYMKTTWHTLGSSLMVQLVQSGLGAYDGKYDPDYPLFSAFVDRCAGIVRKISPSDGDYLKAGWKQKQIEI